MNRIYHTSFRCFFGGGRYNQHNQLLRLEEIPRWLDAYMFTHPGVESISVKIWPKDIKEGTDNADG